MSPELERRWELDRWISIVRLITVPWAVIEVLNDISSVRYRTAAWVVTGTLAVGAVVLLLDRRRGL
jgi:hypothetical protein